MKTINKSKSLNEAGAKSIQTEDCQSAPSLQWYDCTLCGSGESEKLFEKDAFDYVQCSICQLVYVNPRYADHAILNAPFNKIGEEYREGGQENLISREKKYLRKLKRLENYRKENTLLEIGCHEGHFLKVAQIKGWNVFGVEPEPAPAKIARKRFNITIHQGFLETAHYPNGKFDIVYLNEVLEHIDRPIILFNEIRRILRRGGVVYVKTGNFQSVSRLLRGKDWSYFAYKRLGHVTYYSPKTFCFLCKATGLKPKTIRTWGIELPYSPPRTIRKLIRKIIKPFLQLSGLGSHMEGIASRP